MVTLPVAAENVGLWFDIANGADADESLTVNDAAAVLVVTIAQGQSSKIGVADVAGTPTWVIVGAADSDAGSFGAGTAASPSMTFSGDTNTGWYNPAADVIGSGLGGVVALAIGKTSAPTWAAATDVAGTDVFLRAPDAGGTATTAKAGGKMDEKAGVGSTGTTTVAGGVGGAYVIAAGAGGAKTGTGSAAGGAGGAASVTAGAGGATATTGTGDGGAGGAAVATAGVGGAVTGAGATSTGGAGGANTSTAGAGGAATSGTGGAGGVAGLVGGAGGNSSASNGGAGGAVTLTPGAPGTGGTPGVRGSIELKGPVTSPVTSVQSLADSATIVLPTTGINAIVATSTAANKTGIILTAGIIQGQKITLINTSANSLTMAAAGTSNVADGVSCVLPALRCMSFVWESGAARWFREGA